MSLLFGLVILAALFVLLLIFSLMSLAADADRCRQPLDHPGGPPHVRH